MNQLQTMKMWSVLDQIETLYKNLYTSEGNFSDEACDLFVRNLEIPTLRDKESETILKVH